MLLVPTKINTEENNTQPSLKIWRERKIDTAVLSELQIFIVFQLPEEEIHTTRLLRLLTHFNESQQFFDSNKNSENYQKKEN